MKNITLIFLLLLIIHISLSGQDKVTFGYDVAGNRTSGKTILMLRSDVEEEEEEVPAGYADILSDYVFRIFPNPTKGLLKVEFENPDRNNKAIVSLYDLSGKLLLQKETMSSCELDISSHPDGVYLLKILIGTSESEWKVIKH